jgi:ribosomal protein S18 acetylase RimI-like enzyme
MLIREAIKDNSKIIAVQARELLEHVQKTEDVYLCNLEKNTNENITLWIEKVISSQKEIIFVAEDISKSIIGFIMGKITKPFIPESTIKKIGYIDMCWVDSAYRGKEIGKQLVQRIEQFFLEKNIEYVDLNYIIGNEEAEYFWEKEGYKPYRVSSRKKL